MERIKAGQTTREYLRAGTAHIHHKLDTHPVMAVLLSNNVAERDIVKALSVMAAWFNSIAIGCRTLLPQASDYAERLLALLRKDLPKGSVIPLAPPVEPANIEQAWGVYYVMMGSTAGSVVIYNHLKSVFPDCTALNYFSASQENRQRFSQQFLPALEVALDSDTARMRSLPGALMAFQVITSTLANMNELEFSRVSELLEENARLALLNQRLAREEEQQHQKAAFLATMSHEQPC